MVSDAQKRWRQFACALLGASAFATLQVRSAPPTLEALHPLGFACGSTNVVKLAGKVEAWPPQVWGAGEGVEITALTNKNELQFVVAADAAPGVRLMRLFDGEGASEPRPFVIGAGRELVETEPNNRSASAMPVQELPVTINGRLDKGGDVDCFAVRVPAGQRLVAAVDSFVLMSRLDAVLRLVTTNGQPLAWNHDFATIDPRLDWRSETDTQVVVQVYGFAYPATADIRLTGGDAAIYRLHLSVEPPQLAPTNALPSELSLPATARASFTEPGQRRRFKIQLAKDEWLSANVAAESLGSPLDAWLAIENKDGKELTRADDSEGSRDPNLNWKPPEAGEYALVVGSLTRNSGPDQCYELTAKRGAPDFRASLSRSSLVAKAGTTNELKLTFARLFGLTNALQIVVPKLPDGVTCDPVAAPAGDGGVKLNVVAAESAQAWRGPIQVLARDSIQGVERVIPFKLTGSTTDNGVPGGYRVLLADELAHCWLTVVPKPEKKQEDKAAVAK